MEQINEVKQVTATYEEALRYLANESNAKVDKVIESFKGNDAGKLMSHIVMSSIELDAAVKTVAFCYGTTAVQVRSDLEKTKAGE